MAERRLVTGEQALAPGTQAIGLQYALGKYYDDIEAVRARVRTLHAGQPVKQALTPPAYDRGQLDNAASTKSSEV